MTTTPPDAVTGATTDSASAPAAPSPVDAGHSHHGHHHHGDPGHVHGPNCNHDHHHHHAPVRKIQRPGRNEPCHCGSGRKYKKCCLATDGD